MLRKNIICLRVYYRFPYRPIDVVQVVSRVRRVDDAVLRGRVDPLEVERLAPEEVEEARRV